MRYGLNKPAGSGSIEFNGEKYAIEKIVKPDYSLKNTFHLVNIRTFERLIMVLDPAETITWKMDK